MEGFAGWSARRRRWWPRARGLGAALVALQLVTSGAAVAKDAPAAVGIVGMGDVDPPDDAPEIGLSWKGVWLTPFIAPAFTPELGLLIAAGGMLSFRTDRSSPRTSLPASVAYSTSGALVIDGRLRSYWMDDRIRLDVDGWFKDMEDHYFGATYPTQRATLQGEATHYHRRAYQVKPVLLGRLFPSVYAGAAVDVNGTVATDLGPVMARDPAVLASGTQLLNIGTGPIIRLDTRDFPQAATAGILLQGSYTLLRSRQAPRPMFQIIDVDYRQYLGVEPLYGTLAWTLHLRRGLGNVPWSELGTLGSPYDLRGYRWGKYRQKTIAYGMLEYRSTPLDAGGWGHHGGVLWVGGGTLGENFGELEGALPNAGVGYRLVVQQRLNARLDLGFGRASRAMYFNFSEAF